MVFRSNVFSPLNSVVDFAAITLPSKWVRTSEQSPSDLAVTFIGWLGGYHVRAGVRIETIESKIPAAKCMRAPFRSIRGQSLTSAGEKTNHLYKTPQDGIINGLQMR